MRELRYTQRTNDVYARARAAAASLGDHEVQPAHILLSLLDDAKIGLLLESLAVDVDAARGAALGAVGEGREDLTGPLPSSMEALAVRAAALYERPLLEPEQEGLPEHLRALTLVMAPRDVELDAEHVLLGLLAEDEQCAGILRDLGADYERVKEFLVANQPTPTPDQHKETTDSDDAFIARVHEFCGSFARGRILEEALSGELVSHSGPESKQADIRPREADEWHVDETAVMRNEDLVLRVLRYRGQRKGKTLDTCGAQLYRLTPDARIAEIWQFKADPEAYSAFWA